MNVASLELCKELYKLSGWKDPETRHIVADKGTPLYTLGYLLRKLPTENEKKNLELVPRKDGTWFIGYTAGVTVWEHEAYKYIWAEADTPEDAACKLAIELWKQGILK